MLRWDLLKLPSWPVHHLSFLYLSGLVVIVQHFITQADSDLKAEQEKEKKEEEEVEILEREVDQNIAEVSNLFP